MPASCATLSIVTLFSPSRHISRITACWMLCRLKDCQSPFSSATASFRAAIDRSVNFLYCTVNPVLKGSDVTFLCQVGPAPNPPFAPEEDQHRDRDDPHQCQRVPVPVQPVQLRDPLEVHAVDPGDEGERKHDRGE